MKKKAQKKCKKINARYKHTVGRLVDAYHYSYHIQVNVEEERKWDTYE